MIFALLGYNAFRYISLNPMIEILSHIFYIGLGFCCGFDSDYFQWSH